MLFGHNSNVKADDATYHVQTEDRGVAHGLIDTTVYSQGRVLHRRTNTYFDLLPLTPQTEMALKSRVDEQHRTVIQEIMTGVLKLHPGAADTPNSPGPAAATPKKAPAAPKRLLLDLINGKSWLTGKQVSLDICVKEKESDAPWPNVVVSAGIEGALQKNQVSGRTGPDGRVLLEFELPRMGNGDAELVIDAIADDARAQWRFLMKAKARAPKTG